MDWLPDGWKPKLVAVDIDGTLTDGNKVLNLEAIEALRKLERAGIPVTLATGNVRYQLHTDFGDSSDFRGRCVVRMEE